MLKALLCKWKALLLDLFHVFNIAHMWDINRISFVAHIFLRILSFTETRNRGQVHIVPDLSSCWSEPLRAFKKHYYVHRALSKSPIRIQMLLIITLSSSLSKFLMQYCSGADFSIIVAMPARNLKDFSPSGKIHVMIPVNSTTPPNIKVLASFFFHLLRTHYSVLLKKLLWLLTMVGPLSWWAPHTSHFFNYQYIYLESLCKCLKCKFFLACKLHF